jgi:hypothetical protein
MRDMERRTFQLGHPLLLGFLMCGSAWAQAEGPKTNSGVEILKLKWEKQARLPRNFDPSVIPTNDTFRSMESRTAAPGSTQAPYGDEARRDAAARSAALAPVDYFPNAPARMPVFYVYSLTIRNSGTKTIQAVAWDYVFLNASSQTIVGNHHLLTYTTVRASQTLTLKGTERTRPTTVVSATNVKSKPASTRLLERAIIHCVLYDDGTTWRNPAGESECDLLKKNQPAAAQRRQRSQH